MLQRVIRNKEENSDFLMSLKMAKSSLSHALNDITYPNYIDESLNIVMIENIKELIDRISKIEEYVENGDVMILKPE